MDCQGWTNYATWNVTLWMCNDQKLYEIAKQCKDYHEFIKRAGLSGRKTPDGIKWTDASINQDEINGALFNEYFNN